MAETTWVYQGTSTVNLGKRFGKLDYDFFTVNGEDDFTGLVDYYCALCGRLDYQLHGKRQIFEDNKELSPNIKAAMYEHNANVCISFQGEENFEIGVKLKKMVVNRKLAENRYDTSYLFFFLAPGRSDTQTYIKKARAYYHNGHYPEAIMCFTHAIIDNADTVGLYFGRGLAYMEIGEHNNAINDFNRVIELLPEKGAAYLYRGEAYAHQGEFDNAIADFTQAINLDPNDAVGYGYRGYAYARQGEYDNAIADYTQAINLAPNNGESYYNRGLAYKEKGDIQRANTDFDKAKSLGAA
jgi:tetratricopeptide (TPR) repeat protein